MTHDKLMYVSITCLLALVMMFVLFLSSYFMSMRPSIATVDLTRIVNQQVKVLAKANLSKEQTEQRLKQFAEDLTATVKTIAKQHHLTIMPSEAVIAGSLNLTTELEQRLSSRS